MQVEVQVEMDETSQGVILRMFMLIWNAPALGRAIKVNFFAWNHELDGFRPLLFEPFDLTPWFQNAWFFICVS